MISTRTLIEVMISIAAAQLGSGFVIAFVLVRFLAKSDATPRPPRAHRRQPAGGKSAGEAGFVRPGPLAEAAKADWLARNPNYARRLTNPLLWPPDDGDLGQPFV